MLFKEENQYLSILSDILTDGTRVVKDRTGVGTRAVFNRTMDFDLTDFKIPLPSTRKVPIRFMPIELIWFISGNTNIRYLKEHQVNIWDSWVIPETAEYDHDPRSQLKQLEYQGKIKLGPDYEEVYRHLDVNSVNAMMSLITGVKLPDSRLVAGSIGEGAYGAQWRKWEDTRLVDLETAKALIDKGYEIRGQFEEVTEELVSVYDDEGHEAGTTKALVGTNRVVVTKYHDQLQNAIDLIRNQPESRRILVSAWNPGKLDLQALPPCHKSFGYNVRFGADGKKYLNAFLECRSQDFCVGTVANIAQYAMLAHLIAQVTGCIAERLTWFGANVHVYENQLDLAALQLERAPKRNHVQLVLPKSIKEIDHFTHEDLKIVGYNDTHAPIKYPVAI